MNQRPRGAGVVVPFRCIGAVLILWALLLVSHALGGQAQGAGSPDPAFAGSGCELERNLTVTNPPMFGNDVLELRNRLRRLGYDGGNPENDRYDEALARVVRRWQTEAGLFADGIVGPATWEALARDVVLPTTAPAVHHPTGEISIVVDTNRLTLTVYSDGEPFKTYPVAVGRPRELTLTPIGEWRVIHKALNWGGGFGTRWIGLNVPWGIYGIHGTNKPYSIGTRASAGCVRMFNRDVEELYTWIPIGTPVRIIGVKPNIRFDRTLRSGGTGPDVVEMQLRLNETGFVHGDSDGRFGPATERAVRKLQRTYGLPVDGQVWTDMYYILGLMGGADG